MGQNLKFLRRVLLPPPSPVVVNIHSIFAYDVPDTEDVGLPTKFRLSVEPALQPIAGSMPVNRLRRWPSTNLSPGLLYTLRKHVSFNQYCLNAGLSLKQHWGTALGDCTIFSACCIMVVTFKSPALKLLSLRTWNVIFDMFIRTSVQKCQPFPTHSTPLSPK